MSFSNYWTNRSFESIQTEVLPCCFMDKKCKYLGAAIDRQILFHKFPELWTHNLLRDFRDLCLILTDYSKTPFSNYELSLNHFKAIVLRYPSKEERFTLLLQPDQYHKTIILKKLITYNRYDIIEFMFEELDFPFKHGPLNRFGRLIDFHPTHDHQFYVDIEEYEDEDFVMENNSISRYNLLQFTMDHYNGPSYQMVRFMFAKGFLQEEVGYSIAFFNTFLLKILFPDNYMKLDMENVYQTIVFVLDNIYIPSKHVLFYMHILLLRIAVNNVSTINNTIAKIPVMERIFNYIRTKFGIHVSSIKLSTPTLFLIGHGPESQSESSSKISFLHIQLKFLTETFVHSFGWISHFIDYVLDHFFIEEEDLNQLDEEGLNEVQKVCYLLDYLWSVNRDQQVWASNLIIKLINRKVDVFNYKLCKTTGKVITWAKVLKYVNFNRLLSECPSFQERLLQEEESKLDEDFHTALRHLSLQNKTQFLEWKQSSYLLQNR